MNQSLLKPEQWKPLIGKLRTKYYSLCHSALLSPDDIEQEAWLALSKAAEKFDESRGVLFSTYAFATITRNVHRFVSKNLQKEFKNTSLDDWNVLESTEDHHEAVVDVSDSAEKIFAKMSYPDIVYWHVCEGISCREIGRRIGKSHELVRIRIANDLDRMRRSYEATDNN